MQKATSRQACGRFGDGEHVRQQLALEHQAGMQELAVPRAAERQQHVLRYKQARIQPCVERPEHEGLHPPRSDEGAGVGHATSAQDPQRPEVHTLLRVQDRRRTPPDFPAKIA